MGAVIAVAVCSTSPEPIERSTVVATVAAAAICVVWTVVNSFYTAQNLYAHRDPTTYNLAARWLMDHSRMPIPTQPGLFGSPVGYVDASAGFGNSSAGHVYAQGNHLLPVFLAAAGKLFGVAGLLKANVAFAACGLFVLFGLARRIVGPWWALVVMTAMAVSLPLLYVARDTLSEPLALLYLIGGLLLLHRAIAYRRVRDFALAGLITASAAMVRIDAYVALLALVAVAAVILAIARPGRRVASRVAGRGAARRRDRAGLARLGRRRMALERLLPRRAHPHPRADGGDRPRAWSSPPAACCWSGGRRCGPGSRRRAPATGPPRSRPGCSSPRSPSWPPGRSGWWPAVAASTCSSGRFSARPASGPTSAAPTPSSR